jgi:glycosyltransferase involved in cell wall biosynthesis
MVTKFLHHVGGVETYVDWLSGALAEAGHVVACFGMAPPAGEKTMDLGGARLFLTKTRDYHSQNVLSKGRDGFASIYSFVVGRELRDAISVFRPDAIHYHGTCYQLTSAVFRAAMELEITRVLTAHEYKLVCANQRLWDDKAGAVCTACVDGRKVHLAPLRKRCIKGSAAASALGVVEDALSGSILRSDNSLLIHTPSEFMKSTLESAGWSPRRIKHIDLPWTPGRDGMQQKVGGRYAIYPGRLAPEKGLSTLLEAWESVERVDSEICLKIAGDGTDGDRLRSIAAKRELKRITWLGRLNHVDLLDAVANAQFSLHPSDWLENSPIAVRESLSLGVPAIVARKGGMPELIDEGISGSCIDQSPESWSNAILGAARTPYLRGSALINHVASTKIGGRGHLDAMLQLYNRAL